MKKILQTLLILSLLSSTIYGQENDSISPMGQAESGEVVKKENIEKTNLSTINDHISVIYQSFKKVFGENFENAKNKEKIKETLFYIAYYGTAYIDYPNGLVITAEKFASYFRETTNLNLKIYEKFKKDRDDMSKKKYNFSQSDEFINKNNKGGVALHGMRTWWEGKITMNFELLDEKLQEPKFNKYSSKEERLSIIDLQKKLNTENQNIENAKEKISNTNKEILNTEEEISNTEEEISNTEEEISTVREKIIKLEKNRNETISIKNKISNQETKEYFNYALKISKLDGTIKENKQKIKGFEKDIKGFEKDIKGFEKDIKGFEKDIKGFEKDIKNFKEKLFVAKKNILLNIVSDNNPKIKARLDKLIKDKEDFTREDAMKRTKVGGIFIELDGTETKVKGFEKTIKEYEERGFNNLNEKDFMEIGFVLHKIQDIYAHKGGRWVKDHKINAELFRHKDEHSDSEWLIMPDEVKEKSITDITQFLNLILKEEDIKKND